MTVSRRDPVSGKYVTDSDKVKTDRVSNKLSFTGRTTKQNALTTDPVWQISRTTVNGTLTEIDWANDGAWDQVWADRTSLFAPVVYDNQYSTQFDGINDAVDFGNSFNYDSANQWSLSIWFKIDNLTTRRTIYSKTTADANVYGWGIYVEPTGQVFLQVRAPSKLRAHTSTATFAAGVWNNLTMTYTGSGNMSGIRLYFNGVVDTTPASANIGALLSGQSALIGSRNGSFPYPGFMDEMGVWNKSLSASEVNEIWNGGIAANLLEHSASINLVNYYKLGDGDSDPTVFDNKGSVNGTLLNGALFATDAP